MAKLANVDCTAIPCGFVQVAGKKMLRLSLTLRPTPAPSGTGFSILDWPEKIAQQTFVVAVGTGSGLDIAMTEVARIPGTTVVGPGEKVAADRWKQIWADDLGDAYVDLMGKAPPKEADVEPYSYAGLVDLAEHRAQTDIALTLAARFMRKELTRRKGGLEKFATDEKLSMVVVARIKDPNDPTVRIYDNQVLLSRDGFSDVAIGDAFDQVLSTGPSGKPLQAAAAGATPSPQPGFGRAVMPAAAISQLTNRLAATRKTIRNAWMNSGAVGAAATDPWDPFSGFGNPDPGEVGSNRDRFENPMSHPIYGKSVQSAAASGFSDSRFLLDAFDRAFADDSEPVTLLGQAEEKVEVAARYVSTLQGHPTLRKVLRLIVDLPVDEDAVRAVVGAPPQIQGRISVWVDGDAAAARRTRTAFVLRTGSSDPDSFEPCPEPQFLARPGSESLVPSLPLEDGIVKLRLTKKGGAANDARFRLEVLDAIAATLAARTNTQATEGATRNGASAAETPTDEYSQRTRGLSLIDTEMHVAMQIAAMREAGVVPPGVGQYYDADLLFAEDLTDGYRVDIVDKNGVCFPAGARQVDYGPEITAVLNSPEGRSFYGELRTRDEGYIMPMVRTRTETVGGTKQEIDIASETVFCWTGNNLGLPNPNRLDAQTSDYDDYQGFPSEGALPVPMTFGFNPSVKGPILRNGKRYRVLLRARKLNGASVSAVPKALVDKYALGESNASTVGYPFVPVERTPVPDVLVPDDEPLRADDSTADPTLTMTLGADGLRGKATRVLVSPRITQDAAERCDLFKGNDALQQFGVYLKLDVVPTTGAYPPAYSRKTKQGAPVVTAHRFGLRNAPITPPAKPFYIDRDLRFIGMKLSPTGATPAAALGSTTAPGEVAFWTGDFTPDKLKPIRLDAVASQGSKTEIKSPGETTLSHAGRTMPASTLRVEVAPADTVELELWTNRTPETTSMRPTFAKALKLLPTVVSPSLAGRQLTAYTTLNDADWSGVLRDTRIATLHNVLRFRIEHHVKRPLAAPKFLQFDVTRVSGGEEWARIYKTPAKGNQPGSRTVVSFGAVSFSRKSTGQVWAECIWKDVAPERVLVRTGRAEDPDAIDQAGLWSYAPKVRTTRLFEIKDIPPGFTADNSPTQIDLTLDEGGMLRTLMEPAGLFTDNKARRLMVRLGAKTRFAGSFKGSEEELSTYSATRSALEAALAQTGRPPPPSDMREIWLKATKRPAKVELKQEIGAVYGRRFEAATGLLAGHQGKTLRHVYRLWLGDRWLDSGEGEQLAVICADQSSLQALPEWLRGQLSRWGADMTMQPGAPIGGSTFLDPTQIRGAASKTYVVPLPEGQTSSPVESRQVKLALLTPIFDDGKGMWYVDIDIDRAPAFRLELKLGLARYQAHAIKNCELSDIVTAEPFLLHQPWTFSTARKGALIEVIASGPAYAQRAPMIRGLQGNDDVIDDIADLAQHPLITVELERLDKGKPLPVTSETGDPLIVTSKDKDQASNDLFPPTAVDRDGRSGGSAAGWFRWTLPLPVPADMASQKLAVRISLSSAHANSQAENEPAAVGPLVHLPEPLTIQLSA